MTISNMDFRPDWTSAPGETIVDILQERHLSNVEFAERIGHTLDDTENLLQGRATITIALARQLERVLGASVEFWMSRDFQYRQDTERLHEAHSQWLADLPIGDMIKFGWLTPVPHPSEEVTACLRFFNVPSISAWNEKYANLQVAFRTSPSFDSRLAAIATWLRQGEIEAETINCKPWDAENFQESLQYIRALTKIKRPDQFIPELTKRCAENGVALAVVRAPNGCRASGAARFLSPNKALLQFSFRYLTDDHFWFTFFHEAGHLLLHSKKGFFLEGADLPSTTEEDEANKFAALTLIPLELQSTLLNLYADSREVIKFALRLGISPGIVVGQLQHFGKIKRNQLNSLKRYYKWED